MNDNRIKKLRKIMGWNPKKKVFFILIIFSIIVIILIFSIIIFTKNKIENDTSEEESPVNVDGKISTNEWYAQQWGYTYSNNTISQNYWSDYYGTDNNNDGLGDTPYIIDEQNQDNNPIMTPIQIEVISEFSSLMIFQFLILAPLIIIIIRNKIRKKGIE